MKLMEKKPVEITNHLEYPSWGALYCMNNVSIYDLKYVDKLNNGYIYRFIKKENHLTFDSREMLIRIDDLSEVDKIYLDPEKYWEWFYNSYNHNKHNKKVFDEIVKLFSDNFSISTSLTTYNPYS